MYYFWSTSEYISAHVVACYGAYHNGWRFPDSLAVSMNIMECTQYHVRFWQIRYDARSSFALPTCHGYRGNSRYTSLTENLQWAMESLLKGGEGGGWTGPFSPFTYQILYLVRQRDSRENAAHNYMSIDVRDELHWIAFGGATTGKSKRMTSPFGDGEWCNRFFRGYLAN